MSGDVREVATSLALELARPLLIRGLELQRAPTDTMGSILDASGSSAGETGATRVDAVRARLRADIDKLTTELVRRAGADDGEVGLVQLSLARFFDRSILHAARQSAAAETDDAAQPEELPTWGHEWQARTLTRDFNDDGIGASLAERYAKLQHTIENAQSSLARWTALAITLLTQRCEPEHRGGETHGEEGTESADEVRGSVETMALEASFAGAFPPLPSVRPVLVNPQKRRARTALWVLTLVLGLVAPLAVWAMKSAAVEEATSHVVESR